MLGHSSISEIALASGLTIITDGVIITNTGSGQFVVRKHTETGEYVSGRHTETGDYRYDRRLPTAIDLMTLDYIYQGQPFCNITSKPSIDTSSYIYLGQPFFAVENTLIADEAPPATYYGILKRWNGSLWVSTTIKVYISSSFIAKPLKRWDGSGWKLVDTTG